MWKRKRKQFWEWDVELEAWVIRGGFQREVMDRGGLRDRGGWQGKKRGRLPPGKGTLCWEQGREEGAWGPQGLSLATTWKQAVVTSEAWGGQQN